ncbi:MAG: carboxypeptidase-like regulatory domain-containing protein [Alphaproteobacteria bacterium]|uniref:Carboxypeptidase-like regulatory domain-containing protein n=1 Tax=Candidatus Nitrobium versatile TaxID=2884831 RepID=A0A953J4Z8_9BACT|nr:carboxypeptidase-like regulatory domain-containing protein [Candidatus Nitrobium versatile]
MRRRGAGSLIVLLLGALLCPGLFPGGRALSHDLGIREMVLDAGVSPVGKPLRGRIKELTGPATLDQPDTEYVVVNDITAEGTAFTVTASGVTLNLNGYTVTYGTQDAKAAYGVSVEGVKRKNIVLVNGRIVQGEGKCRGKPGSGKNCNPVYAYETFGMEIGGVEISYHAADTHGIYLQWGRDAHIHHSVIRDLGTGVKDRHQGIDALRAGKVVGAKVHHTIVKTRQVGIRVGEEGMVYNNEVHIDSRVTNSVGISAAGGMIHHNKVFGSGVHPIGIWPGRSGKVFSNYVEVQSTREGDEYGDTGAACLRMTWGSGDGMEVMYNTFLLRASRDYKGAGFNSWGRALFVGLPKAEQKAEFHNNVIIALNDDGKAKAAAIAVVCGNMSPHLVFRNNRVESNWANVLLADNYGHADGYARFIDNTFVKRDNYSNYKTVKSQYSSLPSTGVFTGNTMENGASMEDIDLEFSGKGRKEITVGWHLTVEVRDSDGTPVRDAAVVIQDRKGETVFEGITDDGGRAAADVVQYLLTNVHEGESTGKRMKIRKTPHTVVVSYGGKTRKRSVPIEDSKFIHIRI